MRQLQALPSVQLLEREQRPLWQVRRKIRQISRRVWLRRWRNGREISAVQTKRRVTMSGIRRKVVWRVDLSGCRVDFIVRFGCTPSYASDYRCQTLAHV